MLRRLVFPLIAVAVVASLAPVRSAAQVAAGAGASVQFFPLVVVDGGLDTLIQLANGSPQRVFVRCLYTPGGVGGVNEAVDFDLVLNARQPTHWVASTGRLADPTDQPCTNGSTNPPTPANFACDGAGLDPGGIPPLPDGFAGDLLCIQIDRSGAPMSGNALRGLATLVDTAAGDVAKYAAVGLAGTPFNDADETLCLGGEVSEACPRGAEYAACPRSWSLLHRAEGGEPDGLPAHTRLLIATCSRRAGTGGAVAQIFVTNELEQRFSASVPVQRWVEFALADNQLFDRDVLGSDFVQTQLRPAQGSPGFVVIALTSRESADGSATGGLAAAVPHAVGAHVEQDRIVLADE